MMTMIFISYWGCWFC